MNSYEKVKAAADVLNIPAYPDAFDRDDETYITYNISQEEPANFGDDAPGAVICTVQVHLFLPKDTNFFSLRNRLKTELFKQGLTYPEITYNTIETGTDTRHIVFECEDDTEDFSLE